MTEEDNSFKQDSSACFCFFTCEVSIHFFKGAQLGPNCNIYSLLVAVYKKMKLILSRIDFSSLVQPSTKIRVFYVAIWENELPTPALDHRLVQFCYLNYDISHDPATQSLS